VSIDGFTITLSAFAEGMEGDEFRIAPTADAAGFMNVVIRSPEDIAAAARGGSVGDNRNMLTLFDMRQTGSFINSNRSVDDIYRDTLSHVAVETRTSKSSASLEETLLRAATDRRDSIQGVNLEEEAADLVRYQQAYQAAAQVIAAANQVFDTLLRATER
jgi:flagellar hook-associated protein 1 FlgK